MGWCVLMLSWWTTASTASQRAFRCGWLGDGGRSQHVALAACVFGGRGAAWGKKGASVQQHHAVSPPPRKLSVCLWCSWFQASHYVSACSADNAVLCAFLVQALATTRVSIRPAGAMRNEGFVVQAGGMGGMVQRTFSGGPGIMGCFDWFWNDG